MGSKLNPHTVKEGSVQIGLSSNDYTATLAHTHATQQLRILSFFLHCEILIWLIQFALYVYCTVTHSFHTFVVTQKISAIAFTINWIRLYCAVIWDTATAAHACTLSLTAVVALLSTQSPTLVI